MLGKIICWPLNGGKNPHINNTLATAKGGRGRLIEVAVE